MRRFGVATIAVLALCVARAEAQVVHYLTAQTGGGCPATGTETTEDIHVDSVQGSCGSGVGGVDPNWFQYSASANSASGHLNVTGQLGVLDPPASFNPNNHVSVAGIQEKLTPTVPGPIHATLQIAEGVNVGVPSSATRSRCGSTIPAAPSSRSTSATASRRIPTSS